MEKMGKKIEFTQKSQSYFYTLKIVNIRRKCIKKIGKHGKSI